MLLDLLGRLVILALGVALGGLALVAGRRYLQYFVGAGVFFIVLGVFAALGGYDNPWQLFTAGQWVWILIAAALGGLGLIISRRDTKLATMLAGFVAGATLGLWILLAFWDTISPTPTAWAYIVTAIIVVLAGVSAAYWTLHRGDEAIILVTTTVGVVTLSRALNVDPNGKWAAIVILSLALGGVIIQYATLVRERHGLPPLNLS